MSYKNIEDRRRYDREYHARRSVDAKAAKMAAQRARARTIHGLIAEYKRLHGCACRENHPACLDFHHTDGDKEVNIADATRTGWSAKRLQSEIEKCVIVCANCHRKMHYTP